VKFCNFVASLHPHMPANFGRFSLIFSKMALIFPRLLIVFTVSSFEFHQVKLPWLPWQWWLAPIHLTSIHWIIRFGGNAGISSQFFCNRRQNSYEFKDALQLIWSAVPEKAINDASKNHCKCVSANGAHFEHIMW